MQSTSTQADNKVYHVPKLLLSKERPRSLIPNLLGVQREQKVPLPFSLKGRRPGEKPNIRYLSVEAEVRRKISTASTAPITRQEG